jgi:hypothetical protein
MYKNNPMNIKKNLPLIVALLIPFVLTLVVASSVYLPSKGQLPQYDFIYTVFNHREPGTAYYEVVSGKIVQVNTERKPSDIDSPAYLSGPSVELFYYDVESQTSRELTYEEASGYTVDSSWTGPDGYRVEYGSNQGVFPFFDGGYVNALYLIGNGRRIKTSITGYDSNFLAWVTNK